MITHHLQELPESWRDVASVFHALGDDLRQRILLLFEPDEELRIKDIAAVFPCSRTTIVHHLRVLQEAGLLQVRAAGRDRLYSVQRAVLLDAMRRVQTHIEESSR